MDPSKYCVGIFRRGDSFMESFFPCPLQFLLPRHKRHKIGRYLKGNHWKEQRRRLTSTLSWPNRYRFSKASDSSSAPPHAAP